MLVARVFLSLKMEIVMHNSFITITSEMRTNLNLTGNELIVFAIIYGFSQDGESKFAGSRQYLADWCGCTTRQIQNILNDLVERELLIKYEHTNRGVKFCEYVANFTPSEKISLASEKISHYNIDNNIGKENLSSKEERKEISDDTNSKLYSKSDFIGSAKKESRAKRVTVYDKCKSSIYTFTEHAIVQNVLEKYLNLRYQMKDKPIYNITQWDNMLDKLYQIAGTDVNKQIKVINQSVEHGWATFYEIGISKTNKFSEGDGLSCEQNTTTVEERAENLRKRGRTSGF